jgi:hypothetical protein
VTNKHTNEESLGPIPVVMALLALAFAVAGFVLS